jgi:hypothetical protein
MFLFQTLPGRVKKNQIALPSANGSIVLSDNLISRQDLGQKIRLKMIDLLKAQKVRSIFFEQFGHQLLPMLPPVFTVLGKPESKIHGHKGHLGIILLHGVLLSTKHAIFPGSCQHPALAHRVIRCFLLFNVCPDRISLLSFSPVLGYIKNKTPYQILKKGILSMASDKQSIIVPKEQAVFWMDKNGVWHNEHGKFEHPKIIRHFNRSIQKDDQGYYLFQQTDEAEEKVYFCHEDTVLFVVDLSLTEQVILTLNTTDTLPLDPTQLFTRNDGLYLQTSEHCIKFSQHALVKLSRFMEETDGQFCLKLNQTTHPIPER